MPGKTTVDANGVTTIEQGVYPIHNIPMKDLLNAIPTHCFERNHWKSAVYVFWDLFVIGCCYYAAEYVDTLIDPAVYDLGHPYAYKFARFALWSIYGFWAGLFGTGIWVIGHECGHQAFSESKTVNNTVGWILHSAVGVPYHSWRVTHAKHHASTGHLTQDQVFVPSTRSQAGLPPLNPEEEDLQGSRVSKVKAELYESLSDSPIGAALHAASYLIVGWPAYIMWNASGQKRYPKWTNHFNPNAPMFQPHHYNQVMISTFGVMLWLAAIIYAIHLKGFLTVFRVYGVPYLWINHWLVLITFLQHTDPLLPHYRAGEFTFPRGALATMDRHLLGDLGSVMAWIGAHATNGISETHVLHHVCSKIPHYNAWEASASLKKHIAQYGIPTDGGPGGWAEMYRVFRECVFVEDEGDVVFFKNSKGLAVMRHEFVGEAASDSGVEVERK